MPGLRELQELFWRALAEQSPPPELLAAVVDGPPLDATTRVRIYTDAYRWRLTDVLREEAPRLAHHLGAAAFETLVGAYLAAAPSQHPSVAEVGRGLADFCAARPELPPWTADLARLERARQEAFVAADAVGLAPDDLRRLPPAAWGDLPLALVPGATCLVAAWPVHVLWREDEAAIAPARTAYRVWRSGWAVHHAVVDAAEEAALGCVAAGATFADVCEVLDDAATAGGLLLRWIEDGLLARPPGDPVSARRP